MQGNLIISSHSGLTLAESGWGGETGSYFRIFPACDFFSDRAIKSVREIHLSF